MHWRTQERDNLFTILLYYGSITSDNISRPDLPVSTRIPLHLFKKLLERVPDAKGYHMFTDRYYTSILLAEELLKVNCHLTGTIKTNRKGVLTQIKKTQNFQPIKQLHTERIILRFLRVKIKELLPCSPIIIAQTYNLPREHYAVDIS